MRAGTPTPKGNPNSSGSPTPLNKNMNYDSTTPRGVSAVDAGRESAESRAPMCATGTGEREVDDRRPGTFINSRLDYASGIAADMEMDDEVDDEIETELPEGFSRVILGNVDSDANELADGVARVSIAGRSRVVARAQLANLRTAVIKQFRVLYPAGAKISEDAVRQSLTMLWKDIARQSGESNSTTWSQVNSLMKTVRNLDLVKMMTQQELESEEQQWTVVRRHISRSEAMKRAEGDQEEDRKLILWNVPTGLSMQVIHDWINSMLEGDEAMDLISVKRIMPDAEDPSTARIEILAPTRASSDVWFNRIRAAISLRHPEWNIQRGRTYREREEQRVMRAAPAVEQNARGAFVPLSIWSWNAHGMDCSKIADLERCVASTQVDIVLIQESWLFGTYKPVMQEYNWIGVNKAEKTSKRGSGGIGAWVHVSRGNHVRVVDSWNHRIMVLEFDDKAHKAYIINAYAPTLSYARPVRVEFFHQLGAIAQKWQAHGDVILMGDMNARLGRSPVVGDFNESCPLDENGELLENTLKQLDMIALNGRKNCAKPEWTHLWIARPDHPSVLDYACVKSCRMADFRFCVSDKFMGSDHAPLKLWANALKVSAKPARTEATVVRKANYHTLIHDYVGARPIYEMACDEAFADWTETKAEIKSNAADPLEAVNRLHDAIVHRLNQAVERGVPHTRTVIGGAPRSLHRWHDKEVRAAKTDREQKRVAVIKASEAGQDTAPALAAYMEARRHTKNLVREKKQIADAHKQMRMLEGRIENPKMYWRNLKSMAKPSTCSPFGIETLTHPISKQDVSTDAEIADALAAHAAALHNDKGDVSKFKEDFYQEVLVRLRGVEEAVTRECLATDMTRKEWFNDTLTLEEVQKAALNLNYHKAADHEGVRGEALRFASESALQAICDLFNAIFDCGVTPRNWATGTLIFLPKPGDPRQTNNYRGITLLSMIRKLLDRVVLNRMTPKVKIDQAQAGFRKNYSCPDQVFLLSGLLEKNRAEGRKSYVLFVDFKKAFDRVYRDMLALKLYEKGVRGKAWRAIMAMMEGSKGQIRYKNTKSSLFDITMGVAQGAISSPMLFSIFVDDLSAHLRASGVGIELNDQTKVPVLMFADDTALLANTFEQIKLLTKTLEEFCAKWRLEVNESKTELMVIDGDVIEPDLFYGGKKIERVKKFKYLGVWFTEDLRWDTHIDIMISKAEKRIAEYQHLLKGAALTVPAKLQVYKAIIRPILEMAAKSGGHRPSRQQRLRRCSVAVES